MNLHRTKSPYGNFFYSTFVKNKIIGNHLLYKVKKGGLDVNWTFWDTNGRLGTQMDTFATALDEFKTFLAPIQYV